MAEAHDKSDSPAALIERVLQAERDAERSLQEAREKAEALVAGARQQASAISRRSDQRISRLRTSYLARVEEDISAMREADAPGAQGSDPADPADEWSIDRDLLLAAARRVAAELADGPDA